MKKLHVRPKSANPLSRSDNSTKLIKTMNNFKNWKYEMLKNMSKTKDNLFHTENIFQETKKIK